MSAPDAQAVLRPGDVLCVRTGGWFAEAIRIGEELSGKDGEQNHVAMFHHWSGPVPWGLEGRPGGVGWVDLRAYLASPFTVNNCLQPGRTDEARAAVASEAQYMIRTAYDWEAITDDTLRAFRMPDLFASSFRGLVPGHTVCSAYTAFLYERQGWDRPPVTDRDTEPADWAQFCLVNGYSVSLPRES